MLRNWQRPGAGAEGITGRRGEGGWKIKGC